VTEKFEKRCSERLLPPQRALPLRRSFLLAKNAYTETLQITEFLLSPKLHFTHLLLHLHLALFSNLYTHWNVRSSSRIRNFYRNEMNQSHKNSSNSTVSKNAIKPGSVYCSLTTAPILLGTTTLGIWN